MRIGPLGIWELLIILVVVLLIFGPRRLPEMAKGLGQSVREFRKGIRDIKGDFEEGQNEPNQAQPKQASTPDVAATGHSSHQEETSTESPQDGSSSEPSSKNA